SVAPEVPSAIGALVDRALEQDPANRWADARAMQEEVRRVRALPGMAGATPRPVPPEPASAPEPPPERPELATVNEGAPPAMPPAPAHEPPPPPPEAEV